MNTWNYHVRVTQVNYTCLIITLQDMYIYICMYIYTAFYMHMTVHELRNMFIGDEP